MRLLIVDDDADIRQSLGRGLEETGHQVAVEADPERALRQAASGSFDLILCNVRLPRTDGVAFLRRYRADGGAALFIMLSPPGSEEGAIAAMREGAYDWVQKPSEPRKWPGPSRRRRSSSGCGGRSRPCARPPAPPG